MKKALPQKRTDGTFKAVREAVQRRVIAIESRKWHRSFAESHDVLEQLAKEAIAEHRAGRTRPIDPDNM